MKTKALIHFALLFFAGSLLTFSLSPFNIWPAAIAGLILFLYLTKASDKKNIARESFAFSSGLFLSGSYWVYVSINTYGNAHPLLASLLTLVFCLGIAALLIPFMYVFQKYLRQNLWGFTLGFATLWLLNEWLRSWLLTGFPWLFIGYSQTEGPLASYAPIISVYGISLILAFTASSLAFSFIEKKLNPAIICAASLWILAYPLNFIEFTENKTDTPINIALLQPNVDLKEKWLPQNRTPIVEDLIKNTFGLKDTQLVIWPETAIPMQYPYASKSTDAISRTAKDHNLAIITGIPTLWRNEKNYQFHNSMLGLGNASGIYHKQKLVPFGEYVPLESLLRGLIDFFNLPMSQFTQGPDGQEPFKAFDLNIWVYICYEVVYPEFVAQTATKADILVTVSNDAWFGQSIGPIQHLQMAQMRALENGRYMLRATNNGVTAIIGPDGSIKAQLPQFKKGVLQGSVYARKGLTPVAQYGTLAPIFFSLIAVTILLIISKRKRS